MNIRRLLQHLLPKKLYALPLSDAHQEIERAEFFEHLAHETICMKMPMWCHQMTAMPSGTFCVPLCAKCSFKLGVSYLHGDLGLDKTIKSRKMAGTRCQSGTS